MLQLRSNGNLNEIKHIFEKNKQKTQNTATTNTTINLNLSKPTKSKNINLMLEHQDLLKSYNKTIETPTKKNLVTNSKFPKKHIKTNSVQINKTVINKSDSNMNEAEVEALKKESRENCQSKYISKNKVAEVFTSRFNKIKDAKSHFKKNSIIDTIDLKQSSRLSSKGKLDSRNKTNESVRNYSKESNVNPNINTYTEPQRINKINLLTSSKETNNSNMCTLHAKNIVDKSNLNIIKNRIVTSHEIKNNLLIRKNRNKSSNGMIGKSKIKLI